MEFSPSIKSCIHRAYWKSKNIMLKENSGLCDGVTVLRLRIYIVYKQGGYIPDINKDYL